MTAFGYSTCGVCEAQYLTGQPHMCGRPGAGGAQFSQMDLIAAMIHASTFTLKTEVYRLQEGALKDQLLLVQLQRDKDLQSDLIHGLRSQVEGLERRLIAHIDPPEPDFPAPTFDALQNRPD